MKTRVYAILVVSALSLGFASASVAAEEPASPTTAPEGLAQFFSAIKEGRFDRAIEMTLPVEGVPDEFLKAFYEKVGQLTKKNGTQKSVAHLRHGDVAVVIFRDFGLGKTVDLDPAYMVKRDGKWLVVFKLTQFDRPYIKLTDTERSHLKQAEEWFEAQSETIMKLQRSLK